MCSRVPSFNIQYLHAGGIQDSHAQGYSFRRMCSREGRILAHPPDYVCVPALRRKKSFKACDLFFIRLSRWLFEYPEICRIRMNRCYEIVVTRPMQPLIQIGKGSEESVAKNPVTRLIMRCLCSGYCKTRMSWSALDSALEDFRCAKLESFCLILRQCD